MAVNNPISSVYPNFAQPAKPSGIIYPTSFSHVPLAQYPLIPASNSFSTNLQSASNGPTVATVDKNLKVGKTIKHGLLYGLLYGAAASVPLLGLEKAMKINTFKSHFEQFGFEKAARLVGKTKGHFGAYLLSMSLVGALTGAMIAPWEASRIKGRLKDIADVREQQSNGTWQPKNPSLMQRLGLTDKPVTNPDADYQDLLQNQLNPDKAFMQGVKDVFFFKVVKGLIPLGLTLGFVTYAGRNPASTLGQIFAGKAQEFIKLSVHPVFWAKMAALPLIGGFLAKELVPWARNELGIGMTPSNQSRSVPANKSSMVYSATI